MEICLATRAACSISESIICAQFVRKCSRYVFAFEKTVEVPIPPNKAKPANLGRDFGDKFLAADGFAQTYPEHKYLIVEGLRELGYRLRMTGCV